MLWLTLTPELREGAHSAPSPWCLRCGEGDSVDVLLNILLFVPFGTGLAWLGWRRLPSLALAVCLTVSIELTQYFLIPGRDGSIRDVLCNTLGASLGFAIAEFWAFIIFPPPRQSGRAFGLILTLATLLWLGASWGLGGTVPGGAWWVQLNPQGWGSVDFPGQLLSAEINGVTVSSGRLAQPEWLRAQVDSHSVHSRVTLVSGGAVAGRAPVFGVVSEREIEVLRLNQEGEDAQYRYAARGGLAGLAPPIFTLPNTFGRGAGDTIRWRSDYDGRHLTLEARHPGTQTERSSLAITPSLGWLLFWPFEPRPPGQARLITLLWAASLPLLAGYYAACWVEAGAPAVKVLALLIVSWLVNSAGWPLLLGIAPATAAEMIATGAGAIMGWLLCGPLSRAAGHSSLVADRVDLPPKFPSEPDA